MKAISLLGCLWGCLALPALAQSLMPQTLSWDEPAPLSPEVVCEDRQGFIWLGMGKQLLRFDGYDFVAFQHGESLEADISALAADANGLWIGLKNGHVARWSEGQMSIVFRPQEEISISSVAPGQDSLLWVATYGRGIYLLSSRTGRVIQQIGAAQGLPDHYVYTLAATAQGDVWAGSDAGATRLAWMEHEIRSQHYNKQDGLPDYIVKALLIDPEGNLFAGCYEGGLARFDPLSDSFLPLAGTASLPPVSSLAGRGSELWIGTEQTGLWEYQPARQRAMSVTALEGGRIKALCFDQEGNLWVSSQKGGFSRAFTPVQLYQPPLTLKNSSIRSVEASHSGTIWFSTDEGVFAMNPGEGTTELVFEPAKRGWPPVMSLFEDEQGNLWMGTYGGGLIRFNPQSGSLERWAEADGLSNGNVLSITGKGGDIWVGTLGGVSHLTATGGGYRIQNFTRADGISDNYVYQIQLDRAGALWIATDGQGITRLDNTGTRVYQQAEGLTDKVIYSLTLDEHNQIWALSKEGRLYRVDGERAFEITSAYREHRSEPSGLIACHDGAILILHEGGIDRFDPGTGQLVSYGKAVGVDRPSPDLNAMAEDGQGRVWIGSRQGLLLYTPLPVGSRTFPRLVLDKVTLFFEEQPGLLSEPLSAADNHLTFQYLALWYQDPEAVQYRHRMGAYDLDWVKSRDRVVSYPQMPHGSHLFEAEAGLAGTFANHVEAAFRIRPPIYFTWWFWVLVLAAVFVTTVVAVRIREQRLQLASAREKENIQYQFDLLRSQVNPHFLFNSFNTLISLIENHPKEAVSYVERLSDLFRSMLAYRKETLIPLKEELELLANYAYLQLQRYRSNLNIDIAVDPAFHEHLIPPLTLQMLVENAIKHNVISGKQPLQIVVKAQTVEGKPEVMITNPFQPKRQAPPSTGLGLENIRKRYQLLTLRPVETHQEEGTFQVSIPLLL